MNQEFDAISNFFQSRATFKHPTTSLHNGDDASVHEIPDGYDLVVSTDSAIENIHWPIDTPLNIAGNRAVQAALSDLAAMGAEPISIWIAIMAKDLESLEKMSDGIVEACQSHQLELAGGDTAHSPINGINVTVGGIVPKGTAMRRNAAKINDDVWVLGKLGLSATGLQAWQSNQKDSHFIQCFHTITPLLTQGIQLTKLGIKCCIDISDGLLQDANHIATASKLCLNIDAAQIKALPAYQALIKAHTEDESLKFIFTGGEDYALLFTAPKELAAKLLPLGAFRIGECTLGDSVKLIQQGKEIKYNIKGFDHFER